MSVNLKINSCAECPHMVAERYYTGDSFELIYEWKCEQNNGEKITLHEAFDKVPPIPVWCPMR